MAMAITKDKIRPFFHLKNFKDGVTDAVIGKPFSEEAKSSEYGEGYEFGKSLVQSCA